MPRDAIKSAAREVCRVLKHIKGEGVRQIVVKDETVKPLCTLPLGVSPSVVTSTTAESIEGGNRRTWLSHPAHQHPNILGDRITHILIYGEGGY